MKESSAITFEAASALANGAVASQGYRHLLPEGTTNFLSAHYLEAEGCWYFFPVEGVKVPAEQWHLHGFAVAVSKTGQVSSVYDFRDNPQKMQEYLEAFSLYSLGKREEARAAMSAFLKKWPLAKA